MGITFKSFAAAAPYVCAIGKPILLRARHGVGKSSVVYAYAKHCDLPVVERRASQMTEGDLLGLPKVDGECTKWLPPEWLLTACRQPVVLFIDEIDRATVEVRQGFFELTDSRKIAGWTLHPKTLIFAAVNGGDHAAQYQVGEMDPAELDRWTVFDIEPDVEDWLTWAVDNIDPIVLDFIRHNPQHLEHKDDFEPNKVYPSRRSWHRFSDCVVAADGALIEAGETSAVSFNLACAFIGQEGAFALQDFVKQYEKQLSVEDILDKGKWKETKDFDINQQTALVEKIQASGALAEELSDKRVKNLAAWFVALPSEVAMKLWQTMGDGNVNNVIAFHKIKGVGSHIVRILGAEQEKKKEEENSIPK